MALPYRNMQQQLQVMMPVLKEQITYISQDNAIDEFPNFNTEYVEGNLPFVNPQLQYEITLSIQSIRNIGRGDGREFLTFHPDGYDGYYTPTAVLSMQKEIVITVAVENYQLDDFYNSWGIISNIENRLDWNSVTEALAVVNASIASIGTSRNTSFNFGGRLINKAEVDIVVLTSVNDIDYRSSNWIDTMSVDGYYVTDQDRTIQINEDL